MNGFKQLFSTTQSNACVIPLRERRGGFRAKQAEDGVVEVEIYSSSSVLKRIK